MKKSYSQKYDKDNKTYFIYRNGKKIGKAFRSGIGGSQEWTGISYEDNSSSSDYTLKSLKKWFFGWL
jgi:hypothetical protein|tara:strand:- start:2653 stop:2853 length:201 start_codon:yes stop_codon:yes gene_type:complete